MWVAGGGFKPGKLYGKSDEIGDNVTEEMVHVHDLQATISTRYGWTTRS
jgi:hypothetical protein